MVFLSERYVALGARDAFQGARTLSLLLGIDFVPSAQPDEWIWAWRSPLSQSEGWYCELIAPNPRFRGRHPLHLALTDGPALQTLCWAYHAHDFGALSAKANRAKRSFSWLEKLDTDEDGPTLGFLGPGLRTDLPALLFNGFPTLKAVHAVSVESITGVIEHADRERAFFDSLGVSPDLAAGDPEIRTRLRGPKGVLNLSSPPVVFGGATS